MKNYKSYKQLIMTVRDFLRNLAEDRSIPMDVRVYNSLWSMVQSIDHDLNQIDAYRDHIDKVASDLEEQK